MEQNVKPPYQMRSMPTRRELMEAVSLMREVTMTLANEIDALKQRLDAANVPKLTSASPSGIVLLNPSNSTVN